MAKQKFTHFIPRDKPKKRGPRRQHKKNLNIRTKNDITKTYTSLQRTEDNDKQ